jgi:zinc protease
MSRKHMDRRVARALCVVCTGVALLVAAVPARAQRTPAGAEIETVELASPGQPLVAVRLLFEVGSIHDPEGKEGLAALTGLMLGQAGTEEHTYGELLDALYPMAAQIEVNTDREVTGISGVTHVDNLEEYTALLTEAVLHPAFSESDFERNKDQLLSFLTTTLRAANDELLGLEALQQEIFEHHPYGHAPQGTVQGLKSITLDDVRSFYRKHFTRANLLLGVAGGYPEDYPAALKATLSALPAGEKSAKALPPLPEPHGRRFTLIDKDTASVGIQLGYAIPVTRDQDDYYPLMVANSHLGEHRTFNGVLMNQLRGKRGLNYGDYSYIEYYAFPPFTSRPTPNVPRRQQYFSVWIRPVSPDNDRFALRAGLFYVDQMVEEGLSEAQFDLARDFVINYSKLWGQSLSERLGIHMDSRFYGMPYWIDEIERRLTDMTVEDVNEAIREYIRTDAYEAVLVTDDARQTAIELLRDTPSPKEYNSEVEEQVLEDDETIVDLPVEPTAVEIVPVSEMFEER